ncbi:ribosomal large subunit pseudouridine synthase C [Nitrosospira multiformis ATCC 25196]|uniref:Pseudouridine synthase n=1 Tax=Nitrosospira multiformis (strain ATCC 25196 / NCIMB 11849 / C 71) TaxID=323848 RepID=A0A1H5SML0_NITMU|nr:ribosomal large subunit pseudouridine synthase C [Nitrosospira multiformis]SEF51071.1 ribosomal large subunit pseudouridine synthase C [Nitrosospira multiformis ATCC 25196]
MISISRVKDLRKEFPPSPAVREIIGEESKGQRIDNFLIKRLKNVPKSHVYRLLRSGQVRINSKRAPPDYHLQSGDIVRIPPVRTVEKSALPPKKLSKPGFIAFQVLFEDDALIAVNKPPGVAVHGGSGISFGVIEQLRAQHPDWRFLELAHRLDRETSGVLLLAKNRAALVELHRQLRMGEVEKHYLTLVKGRWRNGRQSVRLSLRKYLTPGGERRVAVEKDADEKKGGMSAHTVFILRESWQSFSLLEAELKTGRTHQIRVHLAYLGFPIAGDDKYGDFVLNKDIARRVPGLGRMFLHAWAVEFTHPVTHEKLRLEAPLPDDLQKFLDVMNNPDKPPKLPAERTFS